MVRVRGDVWKSGGGWSEPLLWYARAIKELSRLPASDPLSWRYLAAMHGFDEQAWRDAGYLRPGDALPDMGERKVFWDQCQHQSWYFLPWHRGYLAAFEHIVRDAIMRLGGPADWALPYWNYFGKGGASKLPPCFTDSSWPDGGPNPLKVARRFGTKADLDYINLDSLRASRFESAAAGGHPGFGGPVTAFQHYGNYNGQLESNPHNKVHTMIGGRSGQVAGLMSDPDTAGLDPIFWLHHANIDRLWEVWLLRDPHHGNPSTETWLHGPADRSFAAWRADRSSYTFTASEMLDTRSPRLGYTYDDLSDPLPGSGRMFNRLKRLNLATARIAHSLEVPMTKPQVELIAASGATIELGANPVEARLQVDRPGVARTFSSLRALASDAGLDGAPLHEPDRVFLNLENIRGNYNAALYRVYVGVPQQGNDHYVGAVSMFGVAKASDPARGHGGNGITEVIEITDAIDALHLRGVDDLRELRVRLEPAMEVHEGDQLSVGRISVYRQGS